MSITTVKKLSGGELDARAFTNGVEIPAFRVTLVHATLPVVETDDG
jgi:hypothetical protein